MVPVPFPFRIQIKEKSFRVYRGDWETVFFCAIFALNLLNRHILGLLGLKNFI